MRYIPVTCDQREAMLRAVGVSGVDELYVDVPEAARLTRPLEIPGPMSEIELVGHVRRLADANRPAGSLVSFAGAGSYDHFVPSIVDHVLRRPEFFTAYTPYQPEVSQGTLQAIYEFQSMMCALTGLDVANASMYDGATAFVEGALMACRITRRQRIVVSSAVHPQWRETLRTYVDAGLLELVEADMEDGLTPPSVVAGLVENAAAVLVSSPNFFGCIEDLSSLADVAHESGALLVVASNPVLLGLLEPPAAFGADIVVGEGQPLGNSMSLGGPGFGFFTCRQQHVRQMPGRLVGRTVDLDGNPAFVLTLSTREQHIRREKATSNICSNQALCALAAGVYLAAVGAAGLEGIARTCVSKARYLRSELLLTGRFSAPWESAFGYEFALRFDGDVGRMRAALLERGYLAGVDVGEHIPAHDGLVLFAVTEKVSRAEIDAFVAEVVSL